MQLEIQFHFEKRKVRELNLIWIQIVYWMRYIKKVKSSYRNKDHVLLRERERGLL